jgi:nucleoside-diphosphate-sugar epimerase
MPYTIIRVPAVMGPEDPTGRMWWWVQRALDGGPVVVPTEMRGAFRTLYSADAAANFIRALDAPQTLGQTYYVAMPEIMTVERWVDLIWRAAGHRGKIVYVPLVVIRKTGPLQTYFPPLTRPVSNIHDLSYALELLGIVSTPVEEWVTATVNWYRERYSGGDSEGYGHRGVELSLAVRWSQEYERLAGQFRY